MIPTILMRKLTDQTNLETTLPKKEGQFPKETQTLTRISSLTTW